MIIGQSLAIVFQREFLMSLIILSIEQHLVSFLRYCVIKMFGGHLAPSQIFHTIISIRL